MSKNINSYLQILFLFFSLYLSNVYGQTYNFNILTKYSIKNENSISEKLGYFNMSDNTYGLVVNTNFNGELIGILYDLKNKKSYHYSIEEKKVLNNLYLEFSYLRTNDLSKIYKKTNYFKEMTKFHISDTIQKTEFNLYKSEKNYNNNVAAFEFNINLMSNFKDVFRFFKFTCIDSHYFIINDFDIKEIGIVTTGSSINNKGIKYHYQLKEIKYIDLKLFIP